MSKTYRREPDEQPRPRFTFKQAARKAAKAKAIRASLDTPTQWRGAGAVA